jgi:hypothetical protein
LWPVTPPQSANIYDCRGYSATAVAPGRAALTFCKIIIKLRGHPDVAVVARNDGGDMVYGLNVDEG